VFDEQHKSARRQGLGDLTIRARGGIFIYIATWLVTAIWADIPQEHPLFFYLNTVIFLILALLRTTYYLVYIKYPNASIDTLYRWLVTSVLIAAFHWGLLSAWIIYDSDLVDLKYIYFVTLAAFATGGTSTLSISKAIRFYYPLLIFGPTILLGLLVGDGEFRMLILLAMFLLIYIFEASRVIGKDYWEAISSHELVSKRAQAMKQLSAIDPLTKLGNRAYFDQKYSEEWKRCDRIKSPLSVLMLDLDHFKTLNDSYGHAFGDECLKEVSSILTRELPRETDTIARYGGEEFVILLPDTPLHAAEPIADRLVKAVSQAQLFYNKQAVSTSCSIGVSSSIPDHNCNRQSLLNAADKALYQAKEKGRNRSQLATEIDLTEAGWY